MATAQVEFDDAGMSAVLLGPDIVHALTEVAEYGKLYAISIAPKRTGHYARSFDVEPGTVEFDRGPRAAVKLVNTAGYAASVEWGYRGTAAEPSRSAHRVLGRTLDHLIELAKIEGA